MLMRCFSFSFLINLQKNAENLFSVFIIEYYEVMAVDRNEIL